MGDKGQLGSLTGIITVLIIIGFLIGIGILVLEEMNSINSTSTATVVNESISALSIGGNYVAYNKTSVPCFSNFAVVRAINASGGQVVGVTNYTTVAASGMISATSGASFTGRGINVTYSYNYGTSESCEQISSVISSFEVIPTWLIIIVILLVVGILLAIVFGVLPRSGSESGGMSGFRLGKGNSGVAEI